MFRRGKKTRRMRLRIRLIGTLLASTQKMILTASCMLKASPGPMPGAPLKSPMVSLTKPPLLTDPPPDARLIRFRRLNISALSWTLKRSVTGMFLKTERSTAPYPGPENLLRERFPRNVVGEEQLKAAGLTHSTPPAAAEKL